MANSVNAHVVASQQTRSELLEAGLRILLSQPASAALGHLTATKIASEAGRTSGAFFHQWPTLEAYLHDFIGFVLRPESSVNLLATMERLSTGLADGHTFVRALVDAGRGVPEQTASDPQTVLELLMWNRALHDEEFRDSVREHYTALDSGSAATYEMLMSLIGREPRAPFDPATIGAICASVAQGLSLRASLSPGFYPDQVFGWIMAALIPLLTRDSDDPRDADGFVNDLPIQLKVGAAEPDAETALRSLQ